MTRTFAVHMDVARVARGTLLLLLLLLLALSATSTSSDVARSAVDPRRLHDEGLQHLRGRASGPARSSLAALEAAVPEHGFTQLLRGHCRCRSGRARRPYAHSHAERRATGRRRMLGRAPLRAVRTRRAGATSAQTPLSVGPPLSPRLSRQCCDLLLTRFIHGCTCPCREPHAQGHGLLFDSHRLGHV